MRTSELAAAVLLAGGVLLAGVSSAGPLGAWARFAPDEVAVGGEIGRRMDVTARKLMATDVENVWVRHFRVRKEKPEMFGGFAGWGMALDAIVKAAAHGIGGESFRAFKDRWVAETRALQLADGSISMFTAHQGQWDSHEQAYLLQAFCRDWEYFGARESLEAARKLGDYLIARKSGINLGLETAFLLLSKQTGDTHYLDYCRTAFKIDDTDQAFNEATPVNGTIHVYTWLARALAQMQYVEQGGRSSPAIEANLNETFSRVFSDYSMIAGSMGGRPLWGEVWVDDQVTVGKQGETCVSAYLLRCAAERLLTHPEPRLGDLCERVLCNAFLGAQSHDGKKLRYFIPVDEKGEWWNRDTYCCPNNFRRMMFEVADAVFFKTPDGFAVNLYTPATLKAEDLDVSVETAYPTDGKVTVRVKSAKPGKVRLRIPGWCGLADAGSWRICGYGAGESVFELELPMPVRLVKGRRAQEGRVAVMRGPIVYAAAAAGKSWIGEMDSWFLDCDKPPVWKDGAVEATFFIGNHRQERQSVRLVPFASEARERTYFPTVGACAAVDDELYSQLKNEKEK